MPNADSSPPTSPLARPYAEFGFDVLRKLASQRPDGNVFISPTSIAVALAMTSMAQPARPKAPSCELCMLTHSQSKHSTPPIASSPNR